MGFSDQKEVLKFICWPKGTPTGDSVREWLAGFDDEPEAHDDDPTVETKTVT